MRFIHSSDSFFVNSATPATLGTPNVAWCVTREAFRTAIPRYVGNISIQSKPCGDGLPQNKWVKVGTEAKENIVFTVFYISWSVLRITMGYWGYWQINAFACSPILRESMLILHCGEFTGELLLQTRIQGYYGSRSKGTACSPRFLAGRNGNNLIITRW